MSFENVVEKKKLLKMSYLSFTLSVFYLFEELYAIFIKVKIVVCKPFQFGRVWNLSFGKGLTSNKILDWSKLKTLADDKLNKAHIMMYESDRVVNIVKNGENAGHQLFLLSNDVF